MDIIKRNIKRNSQFPSKLVYIPCMGGITILLMLVTVLDSLLIYVYLFFLQNKLMLLHILNLVKEILKDNIYEVVVNILVEEF